MTDQAATEISRFFPALSAYGCFKHAFPLVTARPMDVRPTVANKRKSFSFTSGGKA